MAPPKKVSVIGPGVLAPGAALDFPTGGGAELGGLAAVISIDSTLFFLTCGHHHPAKNGKLRLRGALEDLGVLDMNLLTLDKPIDAAIYTVNPAGLALLTASRNAPTWNTNVLPPYGYQNTCGVVFWPTNCVGLPPCAATVSSHSATAPWLLAEPVNNGFIRTEVITVAGDSGSLLTLGGSSYGLCTGRGRFYSFYTPIFAVIVRLYQLKQAKGVQLWVP